MKFNPPLYAAWAAILRRVPTARLVLKYRGLEDPANQDRHRQALAAAGGDASRMEFHGWDSGAAYWEAQRQIDVGLDTLPFSGSLTTCNALWMGVRRLNSRAESMPRVGPLS